MASCHRIVRAHALTTADSSSALSEVSHGREDPATRTTRETNSAASICVAYICELDIIEPLARLVRARTSSAANGMAPDQAAGKMPAATMSAGSTRLFTNDPASKVEPKRAVPLLNPSVMRSKLVIDQRMK